MIYCLHCAEENPANLRFCRRCGLLLHRGQSSRLPTGSYRAHWFVEEELESELHLEVRPVTMARTGGDRE